MTPALTARGEGEFVLCGSLPGGLPRRPAAPEAVDPAEETASLHYRFQPEELHLPAKDKGSEGTAEVHFRCVGGERAAGAFRVAAPEGLRVEPQHVDVAALAEGEESVVRLKVRAAGGAAGKLHALRLIPRRGTPAAEQALGVSVGVAMELDGRVPGHARHVVRAPGYTFAVDQFSGVSYYILDADGHRRHGRMHNTNFIFGIPGVQREGKWCLQYRHPCRFVWTRPNGLVVGCDGNYNDHDARLGYTFHEDRIVIALIPPTRRDAIRDVVSGEPAGEAGWGPQASPSARGDSDDRQRVGRQGQGALGNRDLPPVRHDAVGVFHVVVRFGRIAGQDRRLVFAVG